MNREVNSKLLVPKWPSKMVISGVNKNHQIDQKNSVFLCVFRNRDNYRCRRVKKMIKKCRKPTQNIWICEIDWNFEFNSGFVDKCQKCIHDIIKNFEYGWEFIDKSRNHQKIDVNIAADVWQNRGGSTILEINISKDVWQKSSFLLKKHWFLC